MGFTRLSATYLSSSENRAPHLLHSPVNDFCARSKLETDENPHSREMGEEMA
jgi:hypothetical protein